MDEFTLWPIRIGDRYVFPLNLESVDIYKYLETDAYDFEEGFIQNISKKFTDVTQKIRNMFQSSITRCRRIISAWGGVLKKFKGKPITVDQLAGKHFKKKTSSRPKLLNSKLPRHKLSRVSPLEAQQAGYGVKSLIISFNNHGDISIDREESISKSRNKSPNEITNMKNSKYSGEYIDWNFVTINGTKQMEALENALQEIETYLSQGSYESIKRMSYGDKFNSLNERRADMLTLKQLADFSNRFSAISRRYDRIFEKYLRNYQSENSNDQPKIFEEIITFLMTVQMGLNSMTNCLQCIFTIDARFEETCSSLNDLSVFTKEMIDAGIPGKYVAFNIYMVCSEKLKGRGSSSAPIWGQTRLCLFPFIDESSVYKVALNPIGITSNHNESLIYAKYKSKGMEKILAEVKSITTDHAIIVMERLPLTGQNILDKHGSDFALSKIREEREMLKAAQAKGLTRIGDTGPGNTLYRADLSPAVVDYAYSG